MNFLSHIFTAFLISILLTENKQCKECADFAKAFTQK